MARPLRIEFPGALYHITSRGDRRKPIFEDTCDRDRFLCTLSEVVERFNWLCHGYCLMTNHYHLIVETPEANLSKGMRQLNGVYTQAFNRRHRHVGHLFQGRFTSILVDGDSYLLELTRYVVLNPVRAEMVEWPEDWPWSSYLAMVGQRTVSKWLTTDAVLSQFASTRELAVGHYRQFVHDGMGRDSKIWDSLRQQIYLGDATFVEQMQNKASISGDQMTIPEIQRRTPAPSLETIAEQYPGRNEAILAAYETGVYTYREIASYHGLHLATVGRIIRAMLQSEN